VIIERPPVIIALPQPIYMRGAARASTKLAQILPAAIKRVWAPVYFARHDGYDQHVRHRG
jgi:hypothetical protein